MDSNPSRARMRARRRRHHQQLLRVLADELTGLEVAQAEADKALVAAMNQHVPATQVRELLGLKPATFWRRVKAAREAVAAREAQAI